MNITENKVRGDKTETQELLEGSNITESSSNMTIAINNLPVLAEKCN
jgi:hypothetical protein